MSRAGVPRRGRGLLALLVLGILAVSVFCLLRHLDRRLAGRPASARGHGAGRAPDTQGASRIHRVAIVIDDVGFDEDVALELARTGLRLTFAVLPFQRYSHDLAPRLRGLGHEVILHLPMEPLDFPLEKPGEGAVQEGMGAGAIADAVGRDLDAVPEAVGVNNHMGSKVTADPRVMRAVLQVVRDRGLYFLDSRTTADTVAFELALQMGIPAAQRTLFLDDRREGSYIEERVRELLRKAREEGSALGIGHADPVTVAALKRCARLLQSRDIRLVPASELAARDGGST